MAEDETLQRITILLQAKDRDLQRSMDRNNRLIARFAKDADRNLKSTDQTVQRLDARLRSLSDNAAAYGKSIASSMAMGAATAGVGVLTTGLRETLRSMAEIGDQAERAGLGTGEFQEWSFVAQQNRIEVDALVDAFKELQLRADEFVMTGAGGGADAFKRLGFDAEDLGRRMKDPSELMLEMIDRMQGLDKAAQIRVFDEALGGEGGERFVELLDQGEAKLRETIQSARDLGVVLDEEWISRAAEINAKFETLTKIISVNLQQAIVRFGEDFGTLLRIGDQEFTLGDLQQALDDLTLDEAERNLGRGFTDIQYQAAMLASEMRNLADAAGDVDGSADVSALADELERVAAAYMQGAIDGPKLVEQVDDIEDRAADAAQALDDVDGVAFDAVISRLGKLGGVLRGIIGLGREAGAALPGDDAPAGEPFGPVQEVWRNPDVDLPERASQRPERPTFDATENWIYGIEDKGRSAGGGREKDESEYKARAEAIREETKALEAEAASLLLAAGSGYEYTDAIEYARRRADLLYAAQKDGREITPELTAEIERQAAAYVSAAQDVEGLIDKMQELEDRAETGRDAIVGLFMSIRDGAEGVKGALSDLLARMAEVQMQNAVMGLASGGGWFGGAISGLGSLLTPQGHRATGGSVNAGQLYAVNEGKGDTEYFVPSGGGAILTAPQAMAAISGGRSRAQPVVTKAEAVDININVNGAMGNTEIQQMVQTGVSQGLMAYDRQMPDRVKQINAKPRFKG